MYSPEANIVSSACIHTSARIVDTAAGECKSKGLDGADMVGAADEIRVEYHQGRLYVIHLNAVYNCCPDRVQVWDWRAILLNSMKEKRRILLATSPALWM